VRASWERPEKFHLTLKFLGETEPRRVEDLGRAAGRAASGVESFTLALAGTGAFPPRGAARVLWLGVQDAAGGLAELQRRLEAECAREGFPREPRSFHPHLTLARLRDPRDAEALTEAHLAAQFAPATFVISELLLVRSELSSGGSRYTTLSRHALAAST
ncbi:MAG TPA: RNA 2',3'-cyclic phosphodiesterase, partial [Pyrinomonadaceae bacterium]|nr:RNA 2',3'-cyclic phosphodiesterase [Pyrinomonadaceae bacterium]